MGQITPYTVKLMSSAEGRRQNTIAAASCHFVFAATQTADNAINSNHLSFIDFRRQIEPLSEFRTASGVRHAFAHETRSAGLPDSVTFCSNTTIAGDTDTPRERRFTLLFRPNCEVTKRGLEPAPVLAQYTGREPSRKRNST